MKADRQKKLMKTVRTCTGCGSGAPQAGTTEAGHHMLSVSCTVYRKGELRATRNVTVCEECFVQALVMDSRSKVPGKVFAALRERLSAVYNPMRAEDK